MTLEKAWKIYERQVKQREMAYRQSILKSRRNWTIVGISIAIIGLIMLMIGYGLPLKANIISGEKERSLGAIFLILFGWLIPVSVAISFLIGIPASNRKLEEGAPNYLSESKSYYLNCLMAEDIDDDQKDYCKQKLEEIRHKELLYAIRNAANAANTATAVASAAMLHNVINNK